MSGGLPSRVVKHGHSFFALLPMKIVKELAWRKRDTLVAVIQGDALVLWRLDIAKAAGLEPANK